MCLSVWTCVWVSEVICLSIWICKSECLKLWVWVSEYLSLSVWSYESECLKLCVWVSEFVSECLNLCLSVWSYESEYLNLYVWMFEVASWKHPQRNHHDNCYYISAVNYCINEADKQCRSSYFLKPSQDIDDCISVSYKHCLYKSQYTVIWKTKFTINLDYNIYNCKIFLCEEFINGHNFHITVKIIDIKSIGMSCSEVCYTTWKYHL